jgi:hypothetical protein
VSVEAINEEVRALARLDLEGLRDEWRRRYGWPPVLRSPDLVRHMLAWRIQVAAFGGLDSETRRRLRRSSVPTPVSPGPTPGTRISREWKGVSHEVEVTADGFTYDGRRFGSLSEVARTITGARWNGPRFFGLRAPEAPQ